MPQFSEKDINEAKRRVREMQNRASQLIDDNTNSKVNRNNTNVERNARSTAEKSKENNQKCEKEEPSDKKSDDKSLAIILVLILILSNEGADNTLILALLYLLL